MKPSDLPAPYQEGDIVITTRLCYDFDFESTELYSDLYPPLAKGLHLKVLRAYTEHCLDWIVVSGPNERRYDINVAGVAVLENQEDSIENPEIAKRLKGKGLKGTHGYKTKRVYKPVDYKPLVDNPEDLKEEKDLIEKGKRVKDGEVEFESATVPPLGFATGRTWGDK